MKDSYSFDRDREGLDVSYEKHARAYDRIFDRCGIEWYSVEADVGAMGGFGADEYMAPCAAGENDVVLAPGYAANIEVAVAEAQAVAAACRRCDAPEAVHTPGMTTVAQVAAALGVPDGALLKAFPVVLDGRVVRARRRSRRPPRQRGQAPARARLGFPPGASRGDRAAARARRASSARSARRCGSCSTRPCAPTPAATSSAPTVPTSTCAAWFRGATSTTSRRTCAASSLGDTIGGHPVRIEPAIEVGNIFKLGTRYSEPLGASYLDQTGASQTIWMGCYGIGPARDRRRRNRAVRRRAAGSRGRARSRRSTCTW